MNKWWFPAVTALALLNGCATVPQGSIPVVDSGSAVSNSERVSAGNRGYASVQRQAPRAVSEDSGVVVMPQGNSAPMTFAAPQNAPISTGPITPGAYTPPPAAAQPYNSAPVTSNYSMPSSNSAPTGIPRGNTGGGLAADEQLDGPVLALLTTAQQQQGGGDLNGASSSLERAQRIAPREPQVLYRLAQVRLSQGDAPQAEQLARRALTYANGRPDLQASLWNTIAQSREKQGDSAGANLARQKASGN
ncbi:tetratricopeptide repeat protein [Pseudomonas sp. TE3610]